MPFVASTRDLSMPRQSLALLSHRINHRVACSGAFHNVAHLLTSIFPLIRARIRPQGLKEEPLHLR